MADTRPTVVHIITQLEFGGAQQNTLDTCRLLDRERYRVVLVSGPNGHLDPFAARMEDLDFRIVPDLIREVKPRRDLRAYRFLRDHLLEIASDGSPIIVHTHSSKAGILGRLAARAAKVRHVVHTIHGFGHPALGRPWMRRLAIAAERFAARRTDRFVAVARANIAEGHELGLFAGTPVELIRSAFDVESFQSPGVSRQDARLLVGQHGNGPVIGTVACLKPQKDVATLVRAARIVLDTFDDACFVIAGGGSERTRLEALRDRLGLRESVRFLGWLDDIPQFLGALDVFALTSLWEGLPRAVAQAMAAGVAVVATAVDGVRDIVVDGDTGRLAEPGDHHGVARAILDLLEDSEEAKRLARNASRTVVPEFHVTEMIASLDRLYQRLLTRPD